MNCDAFFLDKIAMAVFLNMKRRSTNNLGHQRLIRRSRDTACLLECRVVSRSGYVTRYAVS